MGVMTCNRYECNHIMCDHYSEKHGYICHECLSDLKKVGPCSISDFMNTPAQANVMDSQWSTIVDETFVVQD